MEWVALALAVGLGWFWLDTLKAREIALAAGERACSAEGFQFLDWTVAQTRVRLDRGDDGQVRLRRVYRFEYSETGNDRAAGSVTLLGRQVVALRLDSVAGVRSNVVSLR
ncbi:MAG: DUF3301 domain-containing protein [Betaproteobacteria bacterium]|nr:DUF3301 domain-containing protein [Betaproteobacteria bacterium]